MYQISKLASVYNDLSKSLNILILNVCKNTLVFCKEHDTVTDYFLLERNPYENYFYCKL